LAAVTEQARSRRASREALAGKLAGSAARVAIIGVPNCGKSLIFNRLTGRFSTTANYPYTTVEVEEAQLVINGQAVALFDTPGITGLELESEDEAMTRDLLRDRPPDVIIQCADAGNLVRSLILTAQLAELEIPTVLCLNMLDEATGRGLFFDYHALSEHLGVPVVPVCALDGRGIKELAKKIQHARVPRPVRRTGLDARAPVTGCAGCSAAILADEPKDQRACRASWRTALKSHHLWAQEIADLVVKQGGLEPRHPFWTGLANAAVHPIGAWALLLLTLAIIYLMVVEVGAKFLCGQTNRAIAPLVALVSSWAGHGFVGDVLVGPFGLLTLGLFNAIGTVLPILATFYLPFCVLEEIGYFPRLTVQFDRLLRVVGLNGKAVLPMTLGFGCSSVACMSIRRLETTKERFIAAFLISLGIPCAAQLGVVIAILAVLPLPAIVGAGLAVLALQVTAGAMLGRTYQRIAEFVTEAIPLFLASAATLFILHSVGLLDRLRSLLAPVVVRGLGLPRDYADVLLVTLARREMGAVMLKDMADSHRLNVQQLFIALLVIVLFVPCMTTGMILGRVLGWFRAALVFSAVTAIAIGAGAVVHLLW
jgi:ferrous iron transport protein B